MDFSSAQLSAWIGAYLWPFFRIAAMVGAAPILGARVVPVRIRLGLALAITLVAAPMLGPMPVVDALSIDGMLVSFHQVVIGLAMGFTLRLVFSAIEVAGQIIGQLMGLGFASMLDPQNGVQVPVVSQFYTIMAILLFLSFNGHLVLIQTVVESFRSLPVGNTGLTAHGVQSLVAWGGQMFAGAVLIALPAMISLLVVNLAFGVMTRAAPQLNIFAVGFPVILLFGMLVMLVSLPVIPGQLMRLSESAFAVVRVLAGGG